MFNELTKLINIHHTYWKIIYCHCEFPPLGGAIIEASPFWLITPIYFIAHSKPYIHTFPELCWVLWHKPHPLLPTVFFANSQNVTNLLFQTPPRRFHWFARNFAHSICGPSWQKVITRTLIFQTILKLLNNNFLQISFQAGSVAYLHIGEWHETQVTIWAPEALCKILANYH